MSIILNPPAAVSSGVQLLHANEGSTTGAAAATLDSKAIAGLTIRDHLVVTVTLEVVGQTLPIGVGIWNVTDSKYLARLDDAGDVPIGIQLSDTLLLVSPLTTTRFVARTLVTNPAADHTDSVSGARGTRGYRSVCSVAWTGAFSVGLRIAGVTAGGSLGWAWTIHKVAGQ